MQVTVKLFAFFRDERFISRQFDLEEGTTVRHMVDSLQIPTEEVGVTMINGRHCLLEAVLSAGDILGIFPKIGGG